MSKGSYSIQIRAFGKLEADVEIKSPIDKFFKVLSSEAHKIPDAADLVHGVELHEGEWETPGHVKSWTYTTLEGEKEIFKERLEVDEESKTITMVAVGGHIMDQCKSYKINYKCVPKEEGTLVIISQEYESFKPDDPSPKKYLPFLVKFVTDIDAHIVKSS